MKPFGGFFEFEIPHGDNDYHDKAMALASGRACFHLILQHLKPKKVFLPYYTCNAVIAPLIECNVDYEFYAINAMLEPEYEPILQANEYIVCINYFGLKLELIQRLANKYKDRVIIDNTQAFFEKGYLNSWSFNSARKFFGVPDGGFIYGPDRISTCLKRNIQVRTDYLVNRINGDQSQGYKNYIESEKAITIEIKEISELSKRLLSNINYESVKRARKKNFQVFQEEFSKINLLKISSKFEETPFCYPLLLEKHLPREVFARENIFIPCLWPEVLTRTAVIFDWEKQLALNLLPLPIDHRYSEKECLFAAKKISQIITTFKVD